MAGSLRYADVVLSFVFTPAIAKQKKSNVSLMMQ